MNTKIEIDDGYLTSEFVLYSDGTIDHLTADGVPDNILNGVVDPKDTLQEIVDNVAEHWADGYDLGGADYADIWVTAYRGDKVAHTRIRVVSEDED